MCILDTAIQKAQQFSINLKKKPTNISTKNLLTKMIFLNLKERKDKYTWMLSLNYVQNLIQKEIL